MTADIAFITVNYNTRPLAEKLLRFFREVELPFRHCLVVVDNASTDGSRRMLEEAQGDSLVYIQAGGNLGYGRAVNRGLAAVTSRYACIMNTDLILNRGALVALWNFFERNPEAGVASPVILGSDHRIQGFLFSPGILPLYFPMLGKIGSKLQKLRVARAGSPIRVPGVLGAFFMIRRSCFSDRLFDEDFFFYYEDTELAYRYWLRGIPCHVLPQVSIVHTGGQSTSAAGGRLFQESRRIYVRKCYGSSNARRLAILDRFRLRMKYAKYRLLITLSKADRIRSKYEYYARLVQSE